MKILKIALSLACFFCCLGLSFGIPAENEEVSAGESMLRSAIFVQNRAGEEFQDKIDVLNDMITAGLSEKGFSIIDKHIVAEKFREARDKDAEAKKTIEALTDGAVDFGVKDALKDASALRLAQMIGADYLIVATINSIGHTTKKFKGKDTIYGVDNQVTDYTLRVSINVLEAGLGGSIYSEIVKASERIPQSENLEIQSSEIIDNLLYATAEKAADDIGGRVEEIRLAKTLSGGAVPFTIVTNGIDSATVELDGTAIGSAGPEPADFAALPGIHMMRITRQWFEPWEKPVNIYANQKLDVTLELSEEGIERFKNLEGFKTEMEIAREQSAADAYAKRLLAEGEKKRLEESYEKIDTSKVERLSVGDHTPRVIVEKEEEE